MPAQVWYGEVNAGEHYDALEASAATLQNEQHTSDDRASAYYPPHQVVVVGGDRVSVFGESEQAAEAPVGATGAPAKRLASFADVQSGAELGRGGTGSDSLGPDESATDRDMVLTTNTLRWVEMPWGGEWELIDDDSYQSPWVLVEVPVDWDQGQEAPIPVEPPIEPPMAPPTELVPVWPSGPVDPETGQPTLQPVEVIEGRIQWPPGTTFVRVPWEPPAYGSPGSGGSGSENTPDVLAISRNEDGGYSVRNAAGHMVATVTPQAAVQVEAQGLSVQQFVEAAFNHPGVRTALTENQSAPVSLGIRVSEDGSTYNVELTVGGAPGSGVSYPVLDSDLNPVQGPPQYGSANPRPGNGDYPLTEELRAELDSLVNSPPDPEWPAERSALREWLDERFQEIESAIQAILSPEERVRTAETVLGLVPGIGLTFSIYEFIFGTSPLSGDDASRAIALLGIISGGYGDDALRLVRGGLRSSLADHIADLTNIARSEGRDLVRATPGSRGNWTADLRSPRPNAMYVLDNGHVYRTDALGRVESVEGRLSLDRLDRNTSAQIRAGREGGTGYDGGHLIGHGVGGAGDGINLVAQMSEVNRGRYRVMEREWAQHIADGHTVDVRVTPIWNDSNPSVPSNMVVESWINGVPQPPIEYPNIR